jgi:hypothetical protein
LAGQALGKLTADQIAMCKGEPTMEEHWIAKRSQLRQLLQDQPQWSNRMYADAVGMSVSWVKDWKRVFRCARPDDETIVLGRPRYRRTPLDAYAADVIAAVLDIRDNPPDYCPRVPGPALIQYELQQRFAGTDQRLPRSTSTIWTILDRHQRILRTPQRRHEPFVRPDPLKHWEIDFTDIPSIPADPQGKQQHAAEMFNVVDRGTSLLIETTASDNYTTETSIIAMTSVFLVEGLPDTITMDRDPRFVGGYQGDDFPSAFMRFLLCLDIDLDICPPRRPNLKPFVERVHRTIQEECLQIEPPASVPAACEALKSYRFRYNSERPHQGDACGNQPPYRAFPELPRLRRLPEMIDPDRWLRALHGRQFRRRVQANGSVKMDKRSYHVGKRFRGQQVVLQVDADRREFQIMQGRQEIKSVPIKGLYDELLEFEVYLKLICEEARTEWRQTKRLVRKRRLAWAA